MNLIPMIAYAWADPHETSWHQTRERTDEDRTRLWAVCKYLTEKGGEYNTCDMRVIMEHMPDFCGGMIIHSPQINVYQQGNWGSSQFTSPGDVTGIDLDFSWEGLVKNPNRAIDLALLTGKEYWTDDEVQAYAYRCMASSIASALISHCKRGVVGADVLGGQMSKLAEAMADEGTRDYVGSHISWYGAIDDTTDEETWVARAYPDARTVVGKWKLHKQASWHNANSGNPVEWLPITLHVQGEEEGCDIQEEEWEYEYDGGHQCAYGETYTTPEAIRVCYGDREYVRGVPRSFWRNG